MLSKGKKIFAIQNACELHVRVQSVVAGTESRQNNLLLFGQEVVVVLLCFWLQDLADDARLFDVADTVDRRVSWGALNG